MSKLKGLDAASWVRDAGVWVVAVCENYTEPERKKGRWCQPQARLQSNEVTYKYLPLYVNANCLNVTSEVSVEKKAVLR